MKNKALLHLTMIAVIFGTLPLHAARHLEVSISSPHDGQAVPWRPCVYGKVSDPTAEVWLVISDKSGNHYVEPGPLSVKPDGAFSGRPYAAEKKPAIFNGLNLEMRAIANPSVHLAEGTVMSRWPSGRASSAVIDIVYQDDASDGCLAGAANIETADNQNSPQLSPHPTRVATQPVTADPHPSATLDESSFWRLATQILLLVLAVSFVALAAMPHLAEAAIGRLTGWLTAFARWLVEVVLIFKEGTVQLSRRLFAVSKSQSRNVWDKRGFTVNFRSLSFELLAIPILCLSVVVAFYSESATIVKSLNELFGVESNAMSDTQPGLTASLMDQSTADPPAAAPHGATAGQAQNGFKGVAGQWLKRLSDGFERLWESEPLGFLAMGLAALQATFSVVLLWSMGLSGPLSLRVRTLLRERPLLTQAFLGLTLALTALAAFRGATVTVGPSWVLSMIVSAALSLVLPVILGLTAHYAQESMADWLALMEVSTVVTALNIALGVVIALSTLVLLVIVAVLGVALVLFGLFFVLAGAYLLFAEVMGYFVKELHGTHLPRMKSASVPATVALVVGLAFAAATLFFMIRG